MKTMNAALNFPASLPAASTHKKPTGWEYQAICRALRGDLDAFNELVLAYQDIVFRQAYWMLNEEEAAEDAAQEVFIQVYRKMSIYDGRSFRAWVLKITTNYCLDRIRSAARHPRISLCQTNDEGEEFEPDWMKDTGESPEQAVERSETRHSIACAIHKLTPDYRSAIILIDLQELEYAEAASILQVPIGTIKSRVARGRCQIRTNLMMSACQ
jgi:RNA polymerase sigma-70 factor, ECF subfamily